jgi:hypothetical protein
MSQDVLRADSNKIATPDGVIRREIDGIALSDLFDHVLRLERSGGSKHPPVG